MVSFINDEIYAESTEIGNKIAPLLQGHAPAAVHVALARCIGAFAAQTVRPGERLEELIDTLTLLVGETARHQAEIARAEAAGGSR